MQEFHTKINSNGRILIPAQLRQALQLEPGEEMVMRLENNEIYLSSLKQVLKNAQALVKKHSKGKSLVKLLKETRKQDLENE
ncbi:MAG: AbrB/MazE/SpoVT family DNA-binding domain-containing protein [Gammaproteobacteria bacterium]